MQHSRQLWERAARSVSDNAQILESPSLGDPINPTCTGKLLWSGSFVGDDKCHALSPEVFVKGHCDDQESTVLRYTDSECTSNEVVESAHTDECSQIIQDQVITDYRWTCSANGTMTIRLFQSALAYTEIAPMLVETGSGTLYTRVLLPKCAKNRKVAAIYQQVPYQADYHDGMIIAPWAAFSKMPRLPVIGDICIGLVLQETRGMVNSTGKFDFFRHGIADVDATVEALKSQFWYNGVLLPWGMSAMGIRAFLAGGAETSSLRAQSIGIASPSFYTPTIFDGNELNTGILSAILDFAGLKMEDVAQPVADHEAHSSWWDGAEFTAYDKVAWPSVHWASWFDILGGAAQMNAVNRYREQGWWGVKKMHMLFIDPLGHCALHGLPNYTMQMNATASTAVVGYWGLSTMLMFGLFKDATNKIRSGFALTVFRLFTSLMPRMIVYMMGSAGNYLTTMENFPKVSPIYGYLSVSGKEGILKFDTDVPADATPVSYTYDPADPVPTRGGYLFQDSPNCGPMDQTPISDRPDVISFIGEPLPEKLAIMGAVTARISVASTAEDTDFIVKLLDVYPGTNGPRYNVASGVVRMRWRKGGTTPEKMVPGSIYQVDVDMRAIGWVFATGHRIGVQIQSSSWPEYLPNSNTMDSLNTPILWPRDGQRNVTAHNTVYTGALAGVKMSFVTLPKVKLSDVAPREPPALPMSALMNMMSGERSLYV
jgi:predicted acyl esterase